MRNKKLAYLSIAAAGIFSTAIFQNCSASRFETESSRLPTSLSSKSNTTIYGSTVIPALNMPSSGDNSTGGTPVVVTPGAPSTPTTTPPSNPVNPGGDTGSTSGTCTLAVNVTGDTTGGTTGPMGSKVTYLLTFSDAATKARARSVVPNLLGGQKLNPIEEQNLKLWSKWMNVANNTSSLTTFQIINTGLSPNITAPGSYSRSMVVLDANQKTVCQTNSVLVTIVPDSMKKNLDELINKAMSRYTVNVSANEISRCRIIQQLEVKGTSQNVSNISEILNHYNDCKLKCRAEIEANPKNFSNGKNPNFPTSLNGCEYSVSLLLSANGFSRAVTVRDRIFSAVDIGALFDSSIFGLSAQSDHAKYGISHWAGVSIFEILGGTNTMATEMYLDWNIRPPQEVENLNTQELVPN